MKNLTWQNPGQLFVAQELIKIVKLKCCGIKVYEDHNCNFHNDKLTLSYVGGFTSDRCLEILIQGANDGLYNLLLAGYGSKAILDLLEDVKESPNIKYFGKVNYTDGLRIMYNSDIIYAAYSKANPNHFYAAPNKYYEAMFVGKPIITTKGINVARKVVKHNIGFEVEETYKDLCQIISFIDRKDLNEKGAKAKAMWTKYSTATQDYMSNVYPLKNA